MKVDEKKPHSIHFRMTEDQYSFAAANAEMLGVGVSEYVRMVLNSFMIASKKAEAQVKQIQLGDLENADEQNDIKHLV